MLKIHEFTTVSGELSAVCLRVRDGALELVDQDGAFALPEGALGVVMARYGAPFDREARSLVVASLELEGEGVVRHVRHLAGYDVIARDYVVYEVAGREPLCALATSVAGALGHLGRAARAGSGEQR